MLRFWHLVLMCCPVMGHSLPLVNVVRESRVLQTGDGSFSYDVSLSDGSRISARQSKESESQVVSGEYSFIDDQGNIHTVTYTADKNGFHPHVKFERGKQSSVATGVSTEPPSSLPPVLLKAAPVNETQKEDEEAPLNTIASSLFSGPSNV